VVRRIAAPAAVLIALAGCGGTKSDRAQVTAVVRSYFAALASGNGPELCSLLTGAAKQSLVRSGAVLSVLTHNSKTLSCPDDVKFVTGSLGSDQLAELRKVRLTVASLTGASAGVRATEPKGRTTTVPLEKTAAGWLISTADLHAPAALQATDEGAGQASVMCWANETPVAQRQPSQCDVFGEPEIDANLVRVSDAHWSGWGSGEATATVQVRLGNHAGQTPVAGHVTLSEPRARCKGASFYTRLRVVSAEGARDLRLSGACHAIPLTLR
jgi:hypothetical protein